MSTSANPRSPESGDTIDLDNAAEIIRRSCFKIAAAGEPHASYAREMESVAMAGIELRRRYNALEAENARLTAELSTARERADRAEQTIRTMQALAGEPAPFVRTYTTGSSTPIPDGADRAE